MGRTQQVIVSSFYVLVMVIIENVKLVGYFGCGPLLVLLFRVFNVGMIIQQFTSCAVALLIFPRLKSSSIFSHPSKHENNLDFASLSRCMAMYSLISSRDA